MRSIYCFELTISVVRQLMACSTVFLCCPDLDEYVFDPCLSGVVGHPVHYSLL